jgi:hypothetical protein
MTKTRIVLAILVTGFLVAELSGCAGRDWRRPFHTPVSESRASWLGTPINEAVIQWGAPHRSADIGQDKVYTWKACNAYNHCCNRSLIADSNGTITNYTESGACF